MYFKNGTISEDIKFSGTNLTAFDQVKPCFANLITWLPCFPSLLQTILPTHPLAPKTVATIPEKEERYPGPFFIRAILAAPPSEETSSWPFSRWICEVVERAATPKLHKNTT